MKVFSVREFENILKANGFVFIRQTGDHKIYRSPKGRKLTITATRLNRMVAQRLIKEFDLRID